MESPTAMERARAAEMDGAAQEEGVFADPVDDQGVMAETVVETHGAPQQEYDEYGGFYDEQGNYHDGKGGVYDPEGNFFLAEEDNTQARDADGEYMGDEYGDDGYDKDAGCCKSFMTSVYPLMTVIIILNIITMCMGGVILGVGVYIVRGGNAQLSGFSNVEGVVTSSPIVFAILAIVFGSILIFFSVLGCFLSKHMATGGMFRFIRCMYFIYQSFMILTLLVLLAICILAGVGLGLTKGGDGFSQNVWTDNVQLNPQYNCEQEFRNVCAGFNAFDCLPSSDTRLSNCPGALCASFCGVENTSPESPGRSISQCDACFEAVDENNFNFRQCELWERQEVEFGCSGPINEDLENTYTLVVIVTSIACFFLILLIAAASWKSCSCCQ
ncbi:hypothetical protein FVE85_9644 [Porphyridium purpureum]|uniref:Uncharacterized protein n=1 Tax=Porphyridium purpureum TaxID=35688 RepID=A0A5J4YMG6_PORPP|nr:hypothetical protein FVE85_9644 [Porphyridium purpureum]|eukprot:POR9515..scf246_12